MPFEILQARSADDPADPLYPVPGEQPNSFQTEAADGQLASYLVEGVRSSVKSSNSDKTVGEALDIKGALTITDSRVVFACTKFDTGGGWTGLGYGAVVAGALNAASKAIATRRTRGYSLVGHVRYEWLRAVTAQDRKWGKTPNMLRIISIDPTTPGFITTLALRLAHRQAATEVAREVICRAALANAAKAEGEFKTTLEQFARVLPSTPTSNGIGTSWMLPTKPKSVAQ